MKNLINSVLNQASDIVKKQPWDNLGCYYHQSTKAVAQCKRCGKGICKNCLDRLSKSDEKYVGLCQDCIFEVGIECCHHPSKRAVALCGNCGRGICKECYDIYGDSETILCYDCTVELVKEHLADITAFKERVRKSHITMLVLACIGAVIGLTSCIESGEAGVIIAGLIFGTAIGASLGTILQDIWLSLLTALGMLKEKGGLLSDEGMSSFGWGLVFGLIRTVFMLLVSPIIAAYQCVKRARQMKQAEIIITSDEYILRKMKDYFEYTLVMEKKDGVDLATLAEQGSELFDNTYVQSILKNGEKAAQSELCQDTVMIAANGEIIRSFEPVKRKGKLHR